MLWLVIILLYFQNDTVNVLKFRTLFSFCSQIKCWFSWLELTNCLSEWQIGKTLIRLLLQKQSDLGLPYLSRPFWQVASVQNFRTFAIVPITGASPVITVCHKVISLISLVYSLFQYIIGDGILLSWTGLCGSNDMLWKTHLSINALFFNWFWSSFPKKNWFQPTSSGWGV